MKRYENLVVEERGPALWIFLNRPEVKNAFSLDLGKELLEAVRWGVGRNETAALVLSGRGDSFSAGGDVKKMGETADLKKFFLDISKVVHKTVETIRSTEKPVLAAAPGFVGGIAFGLFLSADLRLASPQARFNAATTRLGLVANGGATYFLPRVAGLARATEVLFLGDIYSADEACRLGIVQRVVDPDRLEPETQALAERLAAGPRQALGRLKKILNASLDSTLADQLERERQAIAWSATTTDFQEGMKAFLEKRKPTFSR